MCIQLVAAGSAVGQRNGKAQAMILMVYGVVLWSVCLYHSLYRTIWSLVHGLLLWSCSGFILHFCVLLRDAFTFGTYPVLFTYSLYIRSYCALGEHRNMIKSMQYIPCLACPSESASDIESCCGRRSIGAQCPQECIKCTNNKI